MLRGERRFLSQKLAPLLAAALLTACSAYPTVTWPTSTPGPTPDLVPISEVLGPDTALTDAPGSTLAARAAALMARVALRP